MSEIADILTRAADLIEPEGAWSRYDMGNCRTSFCLVTAINAAAHGTPFAPGMAAMDVLRCHLNAEGLVQWNEYPGRTQAEVIAKLREAAAKARQS